MFRCFGNVFSLMYQCLKWCFILATQISKTKTNQFWFANSFIIIQDFFFLRVFTWSCGRTANTEYKRWPPVGTAWGTCLSSSWSCNIGHTKDAWRIVTSMHLFKGNLPSNLLGKFCHNTCRKHRVFCMVCVREQRDGGWEVLFWRAKLGGRNYLL